MLYWVIVKFSIIALLFSALTFTSSEVSDDATYKSSGVGM